MLSACTVAETSAAILSHNVESRITIRSSNGVNNAAQTNYRTVNNPNISSPNRQQSSRQNWSNDSIANQIRDSEDDMEGLIIQQQQRYRSANSSSSLNNSAAMYPNDALDFNRWLSVSSYRQQEVASYRSFLAANAGQHNVPPMEQLLTTARSWESCGYSPYQIPPRELWGNMTPTLQLLSVLKGQGILPPGTEIRSVYRSPSLNRCAGGASGSKHMTNGALDIWVPAYDGLTWNIQSLQDGLCQFWQYQGERYNFGLGIYSTGAIHIDTQGYRKWGAGNTRSGSPCRY